MQGFLFHLDKKIKLLYEQNTTVFIKIWILPFGITI